MCLEDFINNYLTKEDVFYTIGKISIKKLFKNIDEIIIYYSKTMSFLFNYKKKIKIPILLYNDIIKILFTINNDKTNYIFLTKDIINLHHENSVVYFTNINDYKKWKN